MPALNLKTFNISEEKNTKKPPKSRTNILNNYVDKGVNEGQRANFLGRDTSFEKQSGVVNLYKEPIRELSDSVQLVYKNNEETTPSYSLKLSNYPQAPKPITKPVTLVF